MKRHLEVSFIVIDSMNVEIQELWKTLYLFQIRYVDWGSLPSFLTSSYCRLASHVTFNNIFQGKQLFL